jgi:hypothetical protein
VKKLGRKEFLPEKMTLAVVAERRAEEPIGLEELKRRLKKDGVP